MDPLSEALIREGIVTSDELQELKETASGQGMILKLLETRSPDEEKIVSLFETRFGIPRADLIEIAPEALSGFSEETAMKYLCIPFAREGKSLCVAMVDPLDLNTIQDISFLTGMTVKPHVASRTEILEGIHSTFRMSTDLVEVMNNAEPAGVEDIELLDEEEEEESQVHDVFQTGVRTEVSGEDDLTAPAIKIVNSLLKAAIEAGASDIHIEPRQKTVEVRFRIDGVLNRQMDIPRWLHPAVVSRIKIMSKLDIANRRTPQDGSIKLKIGESPVDLRVSTLPTHLGEKVVIRLLRADEEEIELEHSGITRDDLEKLRKAYTQPQGMILVTGPTGSGKTTTLHGILKLLNSKEINIITVEDPVEYELEGITQVQVNEKAGLGFANTLRSILRQDPDVVMVGEIRDRETADIAFRASMTGHLVMSTLHTNDTASTISRLIDIGVEPYITASSLLLIVAQRLVRLNCPHCLTEYTPDDSLLSLVPDLPEGMKFIKGGGCPKCNHTGYRGRTAVFEIMEITPTIREMISNSSPVDAIKKKAVSEGMKTLFNSAFEKVVNGQTTIEEVIRVVSVDDATKGKCHVCGTAFIEDKCPVCTVATGTTCENCDADLDIQWKFCPFCGKEKKEIMPERIESRARVVIVDDEPALLKMVEVALRPMNMEVHTASNGREGLEKAKSLQPALIITDINMPVMDGYEMIKALRRNMKTMFIPIIILSSRDTAEDKLRGFTYGSDDYITKPFDYGELQARVKRLIMRTYG